MVGESKFAKEKANAIEADRRYAEKQKGFDPETYVPLDDAAAGREVVARYASEKLFSDEATVFAFAKKAIPCTQHFAVDQGDGVPCEGRNGKSRAHQGTAAL